MVVYTFLLSCIIVENFRRFGETCCRNLNGAVLTPIVKKSTYLRKHCHHLRGINPLTETFIIFQNKLLTPRSRQSGW